MDVGTQLREARVAAGLSQQALAERAATSQATVSAYENGRKEPGLDTFARLLAACGAQIKIVPREFGVVTPSREEYTRRGRELSRVIELAATLPTRHEADLRYPPLKHAAR